MNRTNAAFLSTIRALEALERGPVRHYAPDPAEDFREEEPAVERDAAEFFAAEQCPADSNFR